MQDKNNKVAVILGPTSSGKSEVAIKLAKKLNGEIISADSRQIYRELDIGTGKVFKDLSLPSSILPSGRGGGFSLSSPPQMRRGLYASKCSMQGEELIRKIYYSEGIPHYLIDIVNPTGNYNVSHFKKDAEKIIADILKRGKLPIICGGTGFWIKSVVDNVNFPEVRPNWALRKKLLNKPTEALFKTLKKLDPKRAKNIDRFNKVRLIRAIEICKAINKVPPLPLGEDVRRTVEGKNYYFLQIGIKIDKEKLNSNIKKRLQKRFKQGMIEEVKKLHLQGLSWKKIQSFGLGYYWIPLYLKNNLSREEVSEKVLQAEKDYAKRQMTWFRRDKRIKWLKNYKEIEKETKKFLSNQ